MEQELDEKLGPKGKHNPNRQAYRNGYEDGSVVLGGCKHTIRCPRARTLEGTEVELETYEHFNDEDLLSKAVSAQIIYGVSCRDYQNTINGLDVKPEVKDVSKCAVSRRFIQATSDVLEQLMSRPLDDLPIVALYIEGVGFNNFNQRLNRPAPFKILIIAILRLYRGKNNYYFSVKGLHNVCYRSSTSVR